MREFIRKIYILGLIFALAAGLNVYVGFRHLGTPLRREQERRMEAELEYVVGEISATLSLVEKTLNTAAHYVRIESDEQKVLQFLSELRNQNPSYLAVYLSTPDNRLLHVNGEPSLDDYAIYTPWYSTAAKEEKVTYTRAYPHDAEDRLAVTASRPIYGHDGELLGVVSIDKSLGDMLAFLGEKDAFDHESSLIFSATGDLLVGHSSALHGELEICSAIDYSLFAEPAGVTSLQVNGAAGNLRWQTLPESGFVVATFASSNALLGGRTQEKRVLGTMIVAFGAGLIFLFAFLRVHIVSPMCELGKDILAISLDRDVTYRLPVRRMNSLGMFREALNVRLAQAQEYHKRVTLQKEELSGAYAQLVEREQELQEQYQRIREHEEEIRFMAEYDALTGLKNRRKFQEDLQNSLDGGGSGAVFMVDIDDFQHINDTQGHSYGDRVLWSVARLLEEKLPPEATAYRFGGDEFLIVMCRQPNRIQMHVDKISTLLSEMTPMEGRHDRITASMGVVRYPLEGTTVDELLIKADIALHHAKNTGKNRHCFFEWGMAATFRERVRIERILTEAVQTEGFHLEYQPIVGTQTGEIACFEALVRLKGHRISPAVFIPIAEEADLILPLGYWVMKEVIGQLAAWQQAGKNVKPISVNLTPKQVYDDTLIDFLTTQLAANDVDPTLLELEITEDVLLGDAEATIDIMQRIKSYGIKMALDNYGTGHSFINYLTKMPVTRMKIHRSLTESILGNTTVMKGLISIAHGLGMEVVAEQVEMLEEAHLLSEVGCDYLQGYLFSSPVRPQQAELMFELTYKELLDLSNDKKES